MTKQANKLITLFFLFSLYFPISAQVLFEIEGNPIDLEEFLYVYKKNSFNNPEAFSKDDLESYFKLFVNFKLKVHDAKNRGLDTLSVLINEFESYKEQIRKPYLTDESAIDNLVKEAYNRLKEEVHAAHILLRLDPAANPDDTLLAYNRIIELRKRAISGEPFENLARQYSEDPSAAQNGGDLGYFTSMQMVYPFENTAYHLKKNEVSMPVRTRFGYHIIKLYDKRKSEGKVQVAHIMLRFNRSMTSADSLELKNKAFEIHEKLLKGYNWEEACRVYSEDPSSKNTGGSLRPFGKGNMPPTFSDVCFSLSEEGQISDPFTTPYGWHIVKLEKKIGIEPFEEVSDLIRARITNDERTNIQQVALINRLKKENGFERNDILIQDFVAKFNSGTTTDASAVLAQIGKSQVTVKRFLSDRKSEAPLSDVNINKWLEEQVIAYEESVLPEKYPEFKYLLNEYWEGILLFQVMDETVWAKAANDTSALNTFYKQNTTSYQWGERMSGWLIESSEEEIIDSVHSFVLKHPDIEPDSVKAYLNSNSLTLFKIEEGPFEKDKEFEVAEINWKRGIYRYNNNGIFRLVIFRDKISPQPKKLEEIKGIVISDYQEVLDKEYISTLRKKYQVTIQKKTKKNAFKNPQR